MQLVAPKAAKHPAQAVPSDAAQIPPQATSAAEHPIAVHVEHPDGVMPLPDAFIRSAVLTFRITGWA
ncbi:MAG: hypothetical protein HC903_06260 [Methylacidiphilales bacterium]|nr:hypothetical protein [Candidatus Methylacidiphilales bacterium]NJR19169.1 hypothetical protein [Calothrix sp. CSU_2_0]